jgi:hypothetical protein
MTKKADFNAEEWSVVLQGPPIAGMMVIAADRGGTLRESVSMGRGYAEAREQHGTSELLDEIVSASPEFDRERFRSPEELRDRGPERIGEAIQLLEQKATPEEVSAYRGFVLGLADKVAHAHKEGGILGIGGKEVSEKEQAVLDELAATVGTGGGT